MYTNPLSQLPVALTPSTPKPVLRFEFKHEETGKVRVFNIAEYDDQDQARRSAHHWLHWACLRNDDENPYRYHETLTEVWGYAGVGR